MDDPMKEFKGLLKKLKKDASHFDIALELSNCIDEFEKSHTEQNRPNTIDFGELLPEVLKKQVGFEYDENTKWLKAGDLTYYVADGDENE